MCRDIERNRNHTRSDIHRHRRIILVRNCRVNKMKRALFQKNHLGRRRPCGRRNVGALSCTWKGAAECFLVASDPVEKHGPWAVAGLKVATPSGDPVLGN